MLYDVRDTGQALEYGVRRSLTNLELTFYTDAAWLDLPPELVGLYCINPAREGGGKPVREPLPRAQRAEASPSGSARAPVPPLPVGPPGRHAPDDDKITPRPIFQYDGHAFMACFNEKLIASGVKRQDPTVTRMSVVHAETGNLCGPRGERRDRSGEDGSVRRGPAPPVRVAAA